MSGLAGRGARVLLLATATHDGPTLSSVPQVARGFHELKTLLVEHCGVRPDHVRGILDPDDARMMAKAVAEEAQRAESVLLVYFLGHGLLGPGNELYLAARNTDRLIPGLAEHQALSFVALQQAVSASRAESVVVILDCCFSGRVSLRASTTPAFTSAPAHGLYLIGSAEQLALAPTAATHTAFTGAFLDVLGHGDPRGPRLLTLDAVYDAVFRLLRDRQQPLPRRQAGDRSGNLVIANNPAMSSCSKSATDEEDPLTHVRCPYPGLDAFGPDDAPLFFGRERMTERLLAGVVESVNGLDEPAVRVLVGASGSGKSSLLNAGLLAGLRNEGLPGVPESRAWPCIRFTPGSAPLHRLALQLDAPADAAELCRNDPDAAVGFADRLLENRPGHRLLVLVDQLEEVFTHCADSAERTAFLRALIALASPVVGQPGHAVVVLALRADFYGQAATHPELLPALRDRQLLVEPMSLDELRTAIINPASAAGLTLDDGLADVILHELGVAVDGPAEAGGAGILPLLSHLLWATWRQRSGARLTVAGYRSVGGIAEAIATTAEQVYTGLGAEGQDAVRHLLPRLVRVSDVGADTARRLDRAALLHGLPDPGMAQRAIGRLTEARLLTLDTDTVRLSHEVLLQAWPRLREWIEADRDWLRARQRLADDAAGWDDSGRDPSLLYRGNRLAATRERANEATFWESDGDDLSAVFLSASWRQERRGRNRRRSAVALLAVLAVLASVGLAGALVAQREAAQAQDRELARYLISEAAALRDDNSGLAKQLSLVAYRIDPEVGYAAVLSSQNTPGILNAEEPAYDLAADAEGRVLAISTRDEIVLRGQDRRDEVRVEGPDFGAIAVSGDGTLLAAAQYTDTTTGAGELRVWDITTPMRPRQLGTTALEKPTALALSEDGDTLYAGQYGGDLTVWDIDDRAGSSALSKVATLTDHAALVDSVAVSAERNLLASSSVDGRVRLWSVADSAEPRPLTALKVAPAGNPDGDPLQPLQSVAFDSTGTLLATPGVDLGPHVWRVDDPRTPQRILHPDEKDEGSLGDAPCGGEVNSVAFHPEQPHLAVVCNGGWHVVKYPDAPGEETLSPGASEEGIGSGDPGPILFDPAAPDNLLYPTDNGVQVLDLSNPDRPGVAGFLPGSPSAGGQLSYAAHGRRHLVAVQNVAENTLWDVSDPAHPHRLATYPAPDVFTGGDIALSPDGALLAFAEDQEGQSYGLALRSTDDPEGKPLSVISELDNGIGALAFHPSRPLLAVSDVHGLTAQSQQPESVRIYDIADPRNPREIATLDVEAWDLQFSPDGILTTVVRQGPGEGLAAEKELRQYDLADPDVPRQVWSRQYGPMLFGQAYNADGSRFAVYEEDGTLQIWRIGSEGIPDGEPVSVDVGDDGAGPLEFSPDGTRLALIGRHQNRTELITRPEVWDVSDPEAVVLDYYLPSSSAFYDLTFSPSGEVLAMSRAFAGVDLWDTDPSHIAADLCSAVGDPIDREQWRHHLPDRPYEPPCADPDDDGW